MFLCTETRVQIIKCRSPHWNFQVTKTQCFINIKFGKKLQGIFVCVCVWGGGYFILFPNFFTHKTDIFKLKSASLTSFDENQIRDHRYLIGSNHTIKNFYRNFPKHVTGALFSFISLKLG